MSNFPLLYRSVGLMLIAVLATLGYSCKKKEIKGNLGTYAVVDSVFGPPVPDEFFTKNYEITFKNKRLSGSKIKIEKLGNFEIDGSPLELKAEVDGLAFTIEEQDFKPYSSSYEGHTFNASSGHFVGDSVFFEYAFTNSFGETFVGKGAGVKVD